MFVKKSMKKVSAMLVALAMTAAVIPGCGTSNVDADKTAAAKTSGSNAASASTTVAKKDVTLTVWHFMNDREALMNDFAKEYGASTGVKVDNQLYSSDVMKQKVQAAAVAGTLPDMWTFAGGVGDICRYAETGNILRVDDYLNEWNRFDKSILGLMEVTELTRSQTTDNKKAPLGNYIVPLDVNNMQYLYNKDLFKKAGLDPEAPPKTWAQFIDAGKKLKAAGIIPFASGMGSWCQVSMCSDFQFEYLGTENITKARQAQMSFKDAGLAKAINLFAEMRDAKMFADGSSTMDLPAAEKMFANGQVAMIYDGSWALGVFKSMNPDFKNYGVFPTPKDERAQYEPLIPGGPGAFFTVNAKSKNTKEVMEYLKWLTDKPQQVKYANESLNLPANKNITDADKLAPQLLHFSKSMSLTQPIVPGEHASIADLYAKGLSLVIRGSMTPEQLVEQMDKNNNK